MVAITPIAVTAAPVFALSVTGVDLSDSFQMVFNGFKTMTGMGEESQTLLKWGSFFAASTIGSGLMGAKLNF